MSKRIKSFLLMLMCLFSMIVTTGVSSTAMAANVTITEQQVINKANQLKGSKAEKGMCLGWVVSFWKSLGAEKNTACCANAHGNKVAKNTSQSGIPIGANVYFTGSSTTCPTCHKDAGHVGIYIGSNKVVHSIRNSKSDTKNTIRIDTISTICSWGYKFRGWGFQPGVTVIKGDPVPLKIEISGASYPKGTLKKGKGFELKGKITASENITEIVGTVKDTKTGKTKASSSIKPNAKSVQIYTSKINTGIKFGNLPEGSYQLIITVKTKSGSKEVVKTSFTVKK